MRSQLFTALKVHDAVRLNEEGVRRLVNCQVREAVYYFTRTLEVLHELSITITTSTSTSTSGTSNEVQWPRIWSGPVIAQLRNEHFYLYQQALLFSPGENGSPSPVSGGVSREEVGLYNGATAFNLGLAFHLMGTGTGEDRRQAMAFEKAALCYRQALVDVSAVSRSTERSSGCGCGGGDSTSHSHSGIGSVIKLLALNNHCQISYQLRNLVELQGGLEQIRKLSSRATLWCCQSSLFREQGVLGQLMLNVLVSNEPLNAAAAA
jgi:hypothetical protein